MKKKNDKHNIYSKIYSWFSTAIIGFIFAFILLGMSG